MKLIIINTYIRNAEYIRFIQLLQVGINYIRTQDHETYTFLLCGDLNAYNNVRTDRKGKQTTGVISKDHHLMVFRKLAPIFEQLLLEDVALTFDQAVSTHTCKKTGTETRIEFFFCNKIELLEKVTVHDRDLSDHSILEVFLKSPLSTDVGPGLWRLNNNVLEMNHNLIHNLIKSLQPLSITYDAKKQIIRDNLRSICINRNRVLKAHRENLNKSLLSDSVSAEVIEDAKKQLEILDNEECAEILSTIKNSLKERYEGNPKEVKKWVVKRNPTTFVHSLSKSNGEKITESAEILKEFTEFYKELYADEDVNNIKRFEVLRNFNKKIPADISSTLDDEITLNEIEIAIWKLKCNTAPGPDGLTSELYRQHSKLFAELLLPVLADAWNGRNLPKSFSNAVIKVLPKKEGIKEAKDYRPISLMNADQKVLAHVLAERLKKVLHHIIGEEQVAYLKGRSIHKGINDLELLLQENREDWCLVTIDFVKAFDRVDRKFMFQMLRKIGLPERFISIVEVLYHKTTANLSINGYLSSRIRTTRGVRQGCPLSALLFNLALEPLLEDLRRNFWFSIPAERRFMAYADDLTVFVHQQDLKVLFARLNVFCEGTQFQIQRSKCQIYQPEVTSVQGRTKTLKILGTLKGDPRVCANLEQEKILKALRESNIFFNRWMSLRAKAITMNTFVIPKVLHLCRHQKIRRIVLTAYRKLSLSALWGAGRKSEIAICHLERPVANGGIGWPSLLCHTLAAKLIDLRNLFFSDQTTGELISRNWQRRRNYRKILEADLKLVKITINVTGQENISLITSCGSQIVLNRESTYKELYLVCLKSSADDLKWNIRLTAACDKYKLSTTQFESLSKPLWRDKKLTAFDKNTFYKLLFNCIRDKDVLWDKGVKSNPICFLCDESFENLEHLFGNCPATKPFLEQLHIFSIADVFKNPSTLTIKLVVTILARSWDEDTQICLWKLRSLLPTMS